MLGSYNRIWIVTKLRNLIPFYDLYPEIHGSVCTHEKVDSLGMMETTMNDVSLYYPSPPENLWVKAHGSLVVRN